MVPARNDERDELDEKIEEVKKRSKKSFRETIILVEQVPNETVNGALSQVDKHLEEVKKKTSDIRGDTQKEMKAVRLDDEEEK